MNASTIGYWVSTGLLGLGMAVFGLADLAGAANEALIGIGYPPFLAYILGTWKLLGAIALFTPPSAPIPGLARIKDWAYAGFFFVLTGAIASHLLAGQPVSANVPALIMGGSLAASLALRPDGERLAEARLAST